jgi:hypothetical protein
MLSHAQELTPLEIHWAIGMGGDRDDKAEKTVVDKGGNLYVVGTYEGKMEIPDLKINFVSNGGKDIFLLKIDQQGKIIKAISIGGIGSDKVNDMEIGADSNLYIGGYFENELSILGSNKKHASLGGQDIFWAILNIDLAVINSFSAGGRGMPNDPGRSADEEIMNIHYNSTTGSILLNGYFRNEIDLDSSQKNMFVKNTQGQSDVFFASYHPNGACIWANTINLVSITTTLISTLDSKGDLILGGVFQADCDFDPSTNKAFLSSAQGSKDIFLAKYSPLGILIYANRLGGTGVDQLYDLKRDPEDNIVICGYFQKTVDFDLTNGQKILKSMTTQDGFVASYDEAGNLNFANKFKATTITAENNASFSLAINESDLSIYLNGSFLEAAEFDNPVNPTNKIISAGNSDLFVSHYFKDGKFDYANALGHSENEVSAATAFYNNKLYMVGLFQGSQSTIAASNNTITLFSQGKNDALLLSFNTLKMTEKLFSLSGKISSFEKLTEPCEVQLLFKTSNNQVIVLKSFQAFSREFSFSGLKAGMYTLVAIPSGADASKYQKSYYVKKLSPESANWFRLFGNTSELDLPFISNGNSSRNENSWISIDNLYAAGNTLLINGSETIKESSQLKIYDSKGILVYEKLFHAQEIIGVQYLQLPLAGPGVYTGIVENSEFEPTTFKFLHQN